MAILGKIRERSVFLIIIIAMALFAFVLTGLFDANSPLFNKNTNIVGEINGETISREQFAELVEQQRSQSRNRSSQLQSVKTAWDNLVREKVYETQLKKSGIVVGEKDIWDEILNQSFVQNNPQFKNEAGLFDEDKLKEYIATLEEAANDDEESKAQWLAWLTYERNLKTNLQLKTYSSLIKSGLGATLTEGSRDYNEKNTKIDLEYVHVPFNKISDSLVDVSDDDIEAYVKSRKDQFKSEASRNLTYVKFDIKASPEDEAVIKADVKKIIDDGFLTTSDHAQFLTANGSETPFDQGYYTKSRMVKSLADTIFTFDKGAIYGPYKDGEFFKLSKVVDVKKMPDSVKSRHILITFLGSRAADASTTQTEEQAKKTADSLLSILKRDKSKFESFVTEYSSDKPSIEKGGKYDWYPYSQMVPEFRDFTFEGVVGDMGVVKTDFGFHIIEIEGQKNKQNALQIATFSKKIEASEETENTIFEEAETFASDIANGKDILVIGQQKNYKIMPMYYLKELDERLSTLGDQREIIRWAFEKGTKENDIKRFDITDGYAVVRLDKKIKKGLSIGNEKATIRQKLIDEKKASIIKEQMKGASLNEIAEKYNTSVSESKAVSLNAPVLPKVGRVAELVKSLVNLEENKEYIGIVSNNAVFAVKILKKENAPKMDNFNSFKANLTRTLQGKGSKAYDALKKSAEIEDNRAIFY